MELKRDWAKGYSRLGAAYYGLEQWEEAIKAYEDGEACACCIHSLRMCRVFFEAFFPTLPLPSDAAAASGVAEGVRAPSAFSCTVGQPCLIDLAYAHFWCIILTPSLAPRPTVQPAGLVVDPSNHALQSGLNDALSAKNRGEAAGSSLFGPDAMARQAMDPRGRPLLEDAVFTAKLQQLQAHPELINTMLGDDKIKLVSRRSL